MNIKRTCQFLLDKEPDKPDAKLRYRVKWNNNKNIVAFNVGYRVDIEKWSIETQRCKNNTTHGKKKVAANIINKEIQRFEAAAFEVFSDFEKANHLPDTGAFKKAFNIVIGRIEAQSISFFDIFELYITKTGNLNSWGTSAYNHHNSLKSHLKNFKSDLSFDALNEDTLADFMKYQQSKEAMSRYKSAKTGLRNVTIAKNIASFKSFLRWANKKGFYKGNLHDTFKTRIKGLDIKQEVIHLSWDELIYLYYFKFDRLDLEQTRDVFCFCCFTSLRHSDVLKLKRSDVKENHITIVTKKTTDGLKIELNQYSKAILDKYKNTAFPDNKCLPVTAIQEMNANLKTIGKLVGLNEQIRTVYFVGSQRYEEVYPKYELLSTHCGRRTFVVNSLYLGIPAEVVMEWTGHSDYNAMKPYIKIVDTLKQREMQKFNKG
ncbi:MAG: site-specific integrase [Prevotellaceae bacterium]|nr:site-specific integrase [Prevotellaceae bacterium]